MMATPDEVTEPINPGNISVAQQVLSWSPKEPMREGLTKIAYFDELLKSEGRSSNARRDQVKPSSEA